MCLCCFKNLPRDAVYITASSSFVYISAGACANCCVCEVVLSRNTEHVGCSLPVNCVLFIPLVFNRTERTQLQMVKVGCRGLAVVRVEAAAAAAADGQGQEGSPVPVTDIVGQVLQQIEEGKLKHTK